MRIDSLRLKNYRCFEDRTFTFDPRFTLLIGKNATGKSAILDGMAVALGAALISAPDTASVRIERRDVRRRNRPTEIARDYIEHYPVQVEAIGSIGDKRLSWTRELTRPNSSTTYKKNKRTS